MMRYKTLVNEVILYCKKYQSRGVFYIVSFHQPVFDGFHCAGADLHLLSDLGGSKFHAQQPEYLPFLVAYYHFIG